jgi:hypothetical protein
MPKKYKSRIICPILGELYKYSCWKLLTNGDVVWCILNHENLLKEKSGVTGIRHEDVVKNVQKQILDLWITCKLPTVTEKRVKAKLEAFYKKYRESRIKQKNRKLSKIDLGKLDCESKQLFDIGACKCSEECVCSCELSSSLYDFLCDQRNARLMSRKCKYNGLVF